MFPRTRTVVTAFVFACVLPSLAQALTITLDSPGIVGAIDGKLSGPGGTSPENEIILAEHLLAMAINTTELVGAVPAITCVAPYLPCEYRTGDNDYAAADLTYVDKKDFAENDIPNVDLAHQGNVYLLAKYDGQNAGYVMFYLPDWNANPLFDDNVLPKNAKTIFGKHGISHYTVFAARTTRKVPDGGMTLSLLGMAMAGVGLVARRMKK